MKKEFLERMAEREFRLYARKHLPHPAKIKHPEQIRPLMHKMHLLMNDLKARFNRIPDAARLRFAAYQNIQESMVYDHFKQTYRKVIC